MNGPSLDRPHLRRDLEVVHVRGDTFVLLDPKTQAGFELERKEHAVLELLDGRHDRDSLAAAYEERFGEGLTPRGLDDFLRQLRANGLLEGDAPASFAEAPASGPRPVVQPLSSEDRGAWRNAFFDALVLCFGFLIHPLWLVPVMGLAALAFTGLVRYWDLAVVQWTYLFHALDVPLVLIVLAQILVFVELPRSLLVGMACRRFRGRVRSFGLTLFHGLVPVVVCDPGDSAATFSGRGKLTVVTVGFWFQLAVASIAILGWLATVRFSTLSHFFLILAVPAIFGILLHLNVLMPLTAYQLLALLSNVPHLWKRSRAEAWAWLTLRAGPEPLTRRERFWFRFYGLGSLLWSAAMTAAIVGIGAWILTARFGRAGAVASALLVLRWFQNDIGRWLMGWEQFRWLVRAGGKWYVRWPLRALIIVALLLVALLPYSHEISGECRVVSAYQYGARAQVTAELVDIHVDEGDEVQAGDLLATMTDRNVGADVATTTAQLSEAIADHELLLNGPLPEELAVLERDVDRLHIEVEFQEAEVGRIERLVESGIRSQEQLDQQKRLRDAGEQRLEGARQTLARARIGARSEELAAAQAKVDRLRAELRLHQQRQKLLEIRTPVAGRVVTPFMRERLGQVAQEGDLICVVESEELFLEVEADEAAAANVVEGMEVESRLWALEGATLRGRVVRLAHSAWDDAKLNDYAVRSDRELLIRRPDAGLRNETRFRVYVRLDDEREDLVTGMTGYSKIKVGEERLYRTVSRPLLRFFRTEVWSWLP